MYPHSQFVPRYAGTLIVEVALPSGDIAESFLAFEFFEASNTSTSLLAVTPRVGFIHGDTMITVTGSGFIPSLRPRCRFNVSAQAFDVPEGASFVDVPAQWISDTELRCSSLPLVLPLPFVELPQLWAMGVAVVQGGDVVWSRSDTPLQFAVLIPRLFDSVRFQTIVSYRYTMRDLLPVF